MKTKWIPLAALMLVAAMVLLATCGLKLKEEVRNDRPDEPAMMWKLPPMPDSLSFMGEKVPLERFGIYENLEREMLVNAYFHSQTIRMIKLAPRYFSIVDPILAEAGVPADFRYLMVAESSLNPRALSPAGAAGLWQFMKSTAAEYGLEVTPEVDERYHPEKATRAACRYLQYGYRKYGSWPLVAAAYNAGFGAIDKQTERQRTRNYFDLLLAEETERYLFRILSIKLILETPADFGFQIAEQEKYPLLKTRKTEVSGPVDDFAVFAANQGISYKTLKYYNPWLRENKLTNKEGKTYLLDLPGKDAYPVY